MKRAIDLFAGLCVLAAALVVLGLAERNLWRAVPTEVLDRYAFDRVLPSGLPPTVPLDDLWELCKQPRWIQGWLSRQALADCLSEEPPDPINVEKVQTRWQQAVEAQISYSASVESISLEILQAEIRNLKVLRNKIQLLSGGPLLRFLERLGLVTPERPQEQLDEKLSASDVLKSVAVFASSSVYTKERSAAIRDEQARSSTGGAWRATRDIGLLAVGLKLDYDNARLKPKPHLATDRNSLASRLDWARRAQARAGEPLEKGMIGWLTMITVSALVAVMVAGLLGASPVLVANLFLFAGLGALHLLDLSLTGPAALRHLHTRDFAEGFANLRGQLGGLIWGPTVVFLISLLAARYATKRPLQPVVDGLLRASLRTISMSIILIAGLVIILPMTSALRTEALGFAAAVGGSIFIARYAPLFGAGASSLKLSLFALPLVLAALLTAVLGGMARVDPLGTLGVLVLTCLVVALLLSHGWILRIALFLVLLAILFAYAHFLTTGEDVTGAIDHLLPHHGRMRFMAAYDPLAYGMPDIKQIEWLIRSGINPGTPEVGWGFGNVPWGGFSPTARSQLPISAASDLSFLLLGAVGGLTYALGMVGGLLAVLLLLIQRGLAMAFGAEVRLATRFLCATGAIGLIAAVLRIILNLAGALQVAPLAGLPIAFFSHAPAASIFVLAYCGLLLGALSGQQVSVSEAKP